MLVALGMGAMVLGTTVLAGPPGLEKKNKVPAGFEQGNKEGWQDQFPPGWDQKSDADKEKWKEAVKQGREKVAKAAKDKGLSDDEANAAADDFEKAARQGVDPADGEAIVKEKIGKGKKGKDLADDVAAEVEGKLKGKDKEKGGKGKKD
jgi:hypothetical protein